MSRWLPRLCAIALAILSGLSYAQSSENGSAATTDYAAGDTSNEPGSVGSGSSTAQVSAPVGDTSGKSDTAESSAATPEVGSSATAGDIQTIPVATAPDQAPAPVSAGAEPTQLEDVVVTATKRDKNVRDVPQSIDTMSRDRIARQGVSSVEDILKSSPGTTFNGNNDDGSSNVTIRGVNTSLVRSNNTVPTNSRMLGTITLPNTLDIDPFDLASVEVLKSPQGTLFGGSALSGTIRYIPEMPKFDEFLGRATYGTVSASHSGDTAITKAAMVNVPLANQAGVRYAGISRERPGVIDDLKQGLKDVDKGKNRSDRVIASWIPEYKLKLDYYFQRSKVHADDTGQADNADAFTRSNTPGQSPSDTSNQIQGVDVRYQFDTFAITAEGSKTQSENNAVLNIDRYFGLQNVGSNPANTYLDIQNRSRSIELRAASTARSDIEWGWGLLNNWEWTIGYYSSVIDRILDFTVIPPATLIPGSTTLLQLPGANILFSSVLPGGATAANGNVTYDEKAYFFDATRITFDSFELGIGGRLFDMVSTSHLHNMIAGLTSSDGTQQTENKGFNPKVALTWSFADDASAYAAASKGFRFGGVNLLLDVNDPTAATPPPKSYGPDSLWLYEAGIRTQWFHKRLRADLALFQIDWKNIQLEQSVSFPLQQIYLVNASAAKIDGVELSTQAVLPFEFRLNANAGYTNGFITEPFESSTGHVPAGNSLPGTPKWSGSVSLNHSDALIGPLELTSSVSYSYVGSSWTNIQHSFQTGQYGLLDVSLNLSAQNWPLHPRVSLFVTNLTDKRAPINIISSATGGSAGQYTDYYFNRPRTTTLQFEVGF